MCIFSLPLVLSVRILLDFRAHLLMTVVTLLPVFSSEVLGTQGRM